MNDNQAGSVGLLTVAALFLLMAISGRVPDRIGKEGIEHLPTVEEEASQLTVQDLLGEPGFKELVAEVHLENVAEVAQQRANQTEMALLRQWAQRSGFTASASKMSRALAFEEYVKELVESEFRVQETTGNGFDFLVVDDALGRKTGIEVSIGSLPRLRKVLNFVESRLSGGKVQRAVVVLGIGRDGSVQRGWEQMAATSSSAIRVVPVKIPEEGQLPEPSEAAQILEAIRQSLS